MRASVKPLYDRGCLIPEKELAEIQPVVGNLHIYRCPREPGGEPREMAGISVPMKSNLLKPIIEPRLMGIGTRGLKLRGLEEFKTDRGWVYVLQEWLVEEVRGDGSR